MKPNPSPLGIACPLGNERATVGPFMNRVTAQLQPDDRLFCVLDSVAQDGTREAVEARAQEDERIVAVWAPENRSVVDAYFAGYRAAYDFGCEAILEMDGGLSHPPEKIPEFREGIAEGYDFVCGSRFMPGAHIVTPLNRRILSQGGTALARLFLRSRMSDMTSGFECFNRQAMAYLLEHGVRSRANFFQTEIRHMMHRFRWKEIPFCYTNERVSVGRSAVGESITNLFRLALRS